MSSLPPAAGIYKILCVPTKHVYIGGTNNLANRWRQHLQRLRTGSHENEALQRAWHSFGEAAFRFEIMELVLEPCLLEREQYYLDKLKAANPRYGFNRSPTAGSNEGMKHTPATRVAMSQIRTVIMADPEQRAAVSRVHKGKTISAAHRARISEAARKQTLDPRIRTIFLEQSAGQYRLTSPQGEVFEMTNLKQFCREHGLPYDAFKQTARKSGRTRSGWIVERLAPPERLRKRWAS